MALVKTTLKSELVTMLNQMLRETDKNASVEKFADKLATAIDNYIKTATVTVAFPIPVSVVPGTGIGGTTATGTGTIN